MEADPNDRTETRITPRPRRPWLLCVGIALLFLVLYPLSLGPILYDYDHRNLMGLEFDTIVSIYRPVFLAIDDCEALSIFYFRYCTLWTDYPTVIYVSYYAVNPDGAIFIMFQ